MIPNTYEFTINDAHGLPHVYTGVMHPPDEGMDILWHLMALGGEPLARLAQGLIGDAMQGLGGSGDMSAVLVQLRDKVDLEKIDLPAVARDLRVVVGQLPMTELVHRLLKYADRDGKPLRTDGNRLHFDQAYTANYLEMVHAAGRVIAVNGFLPQFVTSMI